MILNWVKSVYEREYYNSIPRPLLLLIYHKLLLIALLLRHKLLKLKSL